jgi:ADP-ribose pyrophosphatase
MAIDSRRDIYRGHLISVSVTETILPNGVAMSVEAVQHPGAAAVVAVDALGNVILIKQFRPVVGEYVLELPAGKLEPNEDAAQTAVRELREETGFHAQTLNPLGSILSAPGYSTERVVLFLARDLAFAATALENHELVSVAVTPFQEAIKLVNEGAISDAKTVAGLLLAKEALA